MFNRNLLDKVFIPKDKENLFISEIRRIPPINTEDLKNSMKLLFIKTMVNSDLENEKIISIIKGIVNEE